MARTSERRDTDSSDDTGTDAGAHGHVKRRRRGSGGEGKDGAPETRSRRRPRDDNEQPKKRKKRPQFSCAECRRLKLKCDRQVPCSNCVRRRCVELCPDETRPVRVTEESVELRQRLEALEKVLESKGISVPETPGRTVTKRRRSVSSELSALEEPSAQDPCGDVPEVDQLPAQVSPNAVVSGAPIDSTPTFTAPPIEPVHSVHFDFSDPPGGWSPHTSLPRPAPAGTLVGVALPVPISNAREIAVGTSHTSPDEKSFGTLVISQSGRSKYLGPTAASEWLKDQEVPDSPPISRPQSPRPTGQLGTSASGALPAAQFPFDGAERPVSTAYLLYKLPPLDEACVFIDAYYRYFAWHFDVSPRDTFQPIFDRVYSTSPPEKVDSLWLHELALVYITLALGALHNLELPPNDPIADEFFHLSKAALAKGQFLIHNTIAAVQTLHIMAHFCLETERGRNGDNAWPLWGLAMRIIQAMGLHRDPTRWNLPASVVEERRRVFWESHAADIFQANCFSRPNSISPDYIDAALPSEMVYSRFVDRGAIHRGEQPVEEKGFSTLKFELSRIASSVLDHAMKVNAPPYSTVLELHERLCDFEINIPFHLRCRAVLLALPSRYPDPEGAIRDSPEESKRDLHRTFQQFTLYLNVTESIIFLHRPYFVRALHENLPDPTRSVYGQSYLTVVERCNVIIQIVARIHALHPNVTSRHWYFWYHAFNAAVCVGTLIMTTPLNSLAGFALSQIDAAIGLYTAVVQGRASRRMVNNLQWLLKLRQRAADKMARAARSAGSGDKTGNGQVGEEQGEGDADSDDVELLGWRTRLIQRAAKTQTATTISVPSPLNSGTSASPNAAVAATITNALQQHFAPTAGVTGDTNTSPQGGGTEALLHQFWDPMLLQDIPDLMGNVNSFTLGWDWDSTV